MEEDVLTSLQRLFQETPHSIRHDVAARRVSNKNSEFSVIKTTWNSFCRPIAKALPIDTTLKQLNKTILEAYILANFHICRLCSNDEPIPSLDQSFFYNCLSAVSAGLKRKPDPRDVRFRNSAELYRINRPSGYVPPDSSSLSVGWHQNASLQMATNCKNDTSMNFYRRLRRYLKHRYDMDGPQAYQVLKAIHAREYVGDDQIVIRYRLKLPKVFWEKSLDDAPENVMHLQYEILRYFEQYQADHPDDRDKKTRLFTLSPTKRGFGCSHFKMCSLGLQGLLKRAGTTVPNAQPVWKQVADEYWRRLFNIEKFETINRKFAGEILTDGKAVSIVMRKPKPQKETSSSQAIDIESYDFVWGLDPGRTDTFVATNEEGDKKRCSSKEYYNDAGFKTSNRTMRHWQDNDEAVSEAIKNMPSMKTASLEKLGVYISYVLSRADLLLDFYMHKGFRKLKLRRFILAEKKLRSMCLDLAPANKKTLVGFGDWSATDPVGLIKKNPAGPVKRFERRLKRYCTVVSVDEFRSSKLHHICHRPLTNSYNTKKSVSDGEWRKSKVHSVLHCRHSGCGMTMNRDCNASRNILMLLKQSVRSDTSRPMAFCRGTELSKCLGVPVSQEAGGHHQTSGNHSGIIA